MTHDASILRAGSLGGRVLGWATLVALSAACGDLLTVENPTEILASDLDTELAVQAVANGVAGDFNWAYHYVSYMSAHLADELIYTGSDPGIRSPSDGNTTEVPTWSGHTFNRAVVSIFTALDANERFKRIFDDAQAQPATGMVQVYAGYAMLMAADNLCQITLDGSAPHMPEAIYQRAETSFTDALAVASRTGSEELQNQALAGRARARVALADWAGAVADAAAVPQGFQFWALYSTNSPREENIIALYGRAATRRDSGVHPRFYTDARFQDDPRTPFTNRGPRFLGSDGTRQFVEQDKFVNQSSNIPISSWQEARLLEAEASLRLGDVGRAVALIDEVRSAASLDAYAGPVSEESVWEQLLYERAAELWLQGQRLSDLRRTNDPYTQGREVCFPISQIEKDSNRNVS